MLGTAFSSLGDGIQGIAVTWMILQLTGSALAVGGMIAITYLPPLLLAPLAGVFSDHRDSKKMVVRVDILRSLIIGMMVAMLFFDAFSLWLFYLLQLILAMANMFFKPASQTLVKETFQDVDLVDVLSKSSSLNLVASLSGTALAGGLIASYDPVICFELNAATFLSAALCNACLQRIDSQAPKKKGKIEFIKSISQGWNFLVKSQGMLYLLFLSVVSSFSLQMSNTLMGPYVDQYLGGSSTLFAVFEISFALGGVISGLIVSRALRRYGHNIGIITLAGMGVMAAAASYRESIILIVVSLFGLGFFTMLHLVTMQTLIQVNTPKKILGSVSGLRSIVASLTKITSALVVGFSLEKVDIRFVLWGFSGLIVLTLLTSMRMKTIQVPETVRGRQAV